jgi:drug/metabolite transporter (DMT)-like permease
VRRERSGYLVGLSAALLFGASAPVSKLLLDDGVGAQMLAGLLYLGACLAVLPFVSGRGRRREAALRRADLGRLAGIVVAGGIVAPVLLMLGLERMSGVAGSLLLNLEGPLTLLVGIALLREHIGRRAGLGSTVIFAGSALIGLRGSTGDLDTVGAALILFACLGCAIDNNLTQGITVRDPFQIVAVKTGIAAVVNIGLALARSEALPAWELVLAALAVGAFAYGISILFDAYALRMLGAAREAAIFATAPFAGALLAVPLLGERWNLVDVAAATAMAAGVVLLVGARHEHRHTHEALVHDHRHVHDEHHRHEHPPGVDPSQPHSHPHRHEALVHSHPHVSDVHHRHRHGERRRFTHPG